MCELPFPDGSWDVVTSEVGPSLTFTDPATGNAGIYTAVMMGNTPAFLAIRLRVAHGKIVEVEHLLSTKRLISAPPTPFGDVTKLTHDPLTRQLLTPAQRRPRAELIRIADGYFATLAHNDGDAAYAVRTVLPSHRERHGDRARTAARGRSSSAPICSMCASGANP